MSRIIFLILYFYNYYNYIICIYPIVPKFPILSIYSTDTLTNISFSSSKKFLSALVTNLVFLSILLLNLIEYKYYLALYLLPKKYLIFTFSSIYSAYYRYHRLVILYIEQSFNISSSVFFVGLTLSHASQIKSSMVIMLFFTESQRA